MAYAILRTKKLGSWGNVAGSGAHTYRLEGMAPNADPVRTRLNATLVGTHGDVLADVQRRVGEVTDKPRANAVLAVEYLLTASPEWWKDKSEKQIQTWAKAQVAWLRERHGSNLVHAVLHRDETSPHVVAYVVPEVDGRLNCRALLGGRPKLAKLQTDYAAAMGRFGLERGVEGSKARHQAVKRFYAATAEVEQKAAAAVAALRDPAPPPAKRLFQSKADHQTAMATWVKNDRKRTRGLAEAAGKAITGVRVLREENARLRASNGLLTAENDRLREELSRAYEDLGLSKDEVGQLRRLDISLVAAELGYYGQVQPKENAIDLVKRVGGFDYQQAVAWLAAAFGPEHAGAAVREDAHVKAPERPFTPAENRIKREVLRQLDALGCSTYRLSLIAEDGDSKPYLPGKNGGEERFYSREDVVNLIPWLRFENNRGKHIYITPMDDHAYYVLVDDLRLKPAELEARGYAPCLIQRTSWEKHQAVLKVTKDLDRRAVIDFFNQVNRQIGDTEITGLRHPMRLAGFRNVKEKHRRDDPKAAFPFVEVVSAVNRFCTKTIDVIRRRAAPPPAPPAEAPPDRRLGR